MAEEDLNNNIELTDAYRKARRSYGVFASVFIAWELIGITISEVPLDNVKVTLESTEAAPYVLFVLVNYFGIRLTIERFHLNERVRKKRITQIDFWLSHFIGFISILIYLIQTTIDIQLFNQFGESLIMLISVYVIVPIFILVMLFMINYLETQSVEIEESISFSKKTLNQNDEKHPAVIIDRLKTDIEDDNIRLQRNKFSLLLFKFSSVFSILIGTIIPFFLLIFPYSLISSIGFIFIIGIVFLIHKKRILLKERELPF